MSVLARRPHLGGSLHRSDIYKLQHYLLASLSDGFFFVFFLQLISAPTSCPSAGSVVSRPTMLRRSLMKSDRGYTAGNRRGDCLIGEYELFPIDRQTIYHLVLHV